MELQCYCPARRLLLLLLLPAVPGAGAVAVAVLLGSDQRGRRRKKICELL